MQYVYIIINSIVVSSMIFLALMTLKKNYKSRLNHVFILFVISLTIWIISNYISNDITISSKYIIIADYFVFSFSYFAAFSLLWFSVLIANDHLARKIFNILSIPLIIIGLLSFSSLIVAGVEIQDKVYAVEFGKGIILYGAALISMLLGALFILYKNLRVTSGVQKERLRILFWSLCCALPLVLLTEFILPTTTGWFGLTNIGILPMFILVGALYYSVVRHRLFDLRLVLAISLAYVISITVVVVIYAGLSFRIARELFGANLDLRQELFFIVFTLILVISFYPIKKYFDKVTNHFFYRDAYDPQEVLNKLNAQLVKSNNMDRLTKASMDIIFDNIHPQFVCIVILDPSGGHTFYYGSKKNKFTVSEEHNLVNYIMNSDHRSFVPDSAGQDGNMSSQKIYRKHQIAVSSKLMAGDDVIGFKILGDRKSGNPYSNRDIQLLETAADSIAIAAQNTLRYEEIAAFNLTLQKKIQDATLELQKSNAKLKALDDAKDEFISMASHQLRTPLTSIKGYISMILEGDAGKISDTQRNYLNQAFISSQRMVYLIADLLNVSRVKTGKFIIESKPTYLPDIVTSELGQLSETAKARGLTLKFAPTPKGFPVLNLDETKIRQVIMNFADNAIYYTPKGGEITVALNMTKESVECTVNDTGIGVSNSEQHHLFTKFYRAGNARKARPDGTGLGLFMAKKVIAAQGGAVVFKSTINKGSTFGFTFPRAKLEVKSPST